MVESSRSAIELRRLILNRLFPKYPLARTYLPHYQNNILKNVSDMPVLDGSIMNRAIATIIQSRNRGLAKVALEYSKANNIRQRSLTELEFEDLDTYLEEFICKRLKKHTEFDWSFTNEFSFTVLHLARMAFFVGYEISDEYSNNFKDATMDINYQIAYTILLELAKNSDFEHTKGEITEKDSDFVDFFKECMRDGAYSKWHSTIIK